MNIFEEQPNRTISLKEIYKIFVKYDKIYDNYPESYYEGKSMADFLNDELAGYSCLNISNEDWINQEI